MSWSIGDDVSFDFGYNVLGLPGQLSGRGVIENYIFAGNAVFTLRSLRTGTRFTYRVRARKSNVDGKIIHFVSLLRGDDNYEDFAYMGCIINRREFKRTLHSRVGVKAQSMVAWTWFFASLFQVKPMHKDLEVWSEGCCRRCGRRLTVPESIMTGYGPECFSALI